MKTNRTYRRGYAALALILTLAACNDLAGPGPGAGSGETIPPGMGLARIRLDAGGPAQNVRTAVPDIGSLYFTLDFTAPGKSPVNETLDGSETPALTLAVFLEPAVWNLEVNGYEDDSMANHKVRGDISVPIVEGTPAVFDVYLAPGSGGTGSLSYSIDLSGLPASAQGWLALYPIDNTPGTGEEIDISSNAEGIASGTLPGLSAGSYRAVIDLYDSGSNGAATWTGAAHIYDGSTTSLTRTFAAADLAPCPAVVTADTNTLAAKLDAALASPAGAYTIVLDGTETDLAAFTPKTLNVTGDKDITITLRGNGNEVQLGSNGQLFLLQPSSGSNLTLILQDVTLKGRPGNSACVVEMHHRGTLLMKAGSLITGNTSSYHGGAVCVYDDGILNVSGGAISGNTTTNSYGGGIYVSGSWATFIMSGGAVSGNTASSSGGGVYVTYGATFDMSGGAVSGNTLSGAYGYGKEVLLNSGTFKISGDARPERIFLSNSSQAITISGALTGGPVPIDLGITSNDPLTDWENQQILRLDGSGFGNLASLKGHFTLGNSKLMLEWPYTETPLTGYKIDDNGRFATESP